MDEVIPRMKVGDLVRIHGSHRTAPIAIVLRVKRFKPDKFDSVLLYWDYRKDTVYPCRDWEAAHNLEKVL